MLHTYVHGDPSSAPLLIVHGLFGSGRNWSVIAKRLSDTYHVTAPDLRNHGQSPWFDTHSYIDLAEDIAPLAGGDVVGHSMGGKAAMMLALTHPDRVRRLVVADIAPVTYSHTQVHNIHAMKAVDLSAITRRSEAGPLLDVEDDVRPFLLQSVDIESKRWRLNLDVLEDEMSKILSFPEITGAFEGPTLFLSGANSDYVRPEYRARIKELFPAAKFAKIPDAGHWLHADRPRAFEAAVRAFLPV